MRERERGTPEQQEEEEEEKRCEGEA